MLEKRHQNGAPNARLDVFFGDVGCTPGEHRRQRVEVRLEYRVDRDHLVADAERTREVFRVAQTVLRRIPRRHRHAGHLRGSERGGGEGGGHGGVDPARESQDHTGKPALSHIVAKAQRERLEGFFLRTGADLGERAGDGHRAAARIDVVDEKVLLEIATADDERPGGIEPERVAVEDELVVSAHLVHVVQRPAILRGLLPDHVAAQRRLADREGARRDVQQDRRAAVGELADRIARIQPLGPVVAIVPDLLADGQPERHALELERLDPRAGLEIPILVEHVVGGQERLVVPPDDVSRVAQGGGVEQRVALPRGVRRHAADDEAEPLVGQCRDSLEQVEVGLDEAVVVEQVPGRITSRGQFGEDDQVGTRAAGAIDSLPDLLKCVFERADGEVQLREREPHGAMVLVRSS